MSKRRTQIDRAVEAIETQRRALVVAHEAEIAGLDKAIAALRSQPARKPRMTKPREVARPA